MVHWMHRRSSEGPLWLMYWGYNIYDVLSESCISQTARWSIQCTRDHWRSRFDWCTEVTHIYDVLLESCTSQLSIDVRYPTRHLVVPSSYRKQLDGPFDAPKIIRGAALTDILSLQICLIYCWSPAYHTAFHWSKILNKKLAGPPIISQTAGWYISCTADHRKGRPSADVSNKKESKCRSMLAGVRIM